MTLRTTVWTTVCRLAELLPERGAAVLLGDAQIAVFRLHDDTVRAIGNLDPLSGAHVLARGIVGSRGGVPVVASPMHKQSYDLLTGRCLDAPDVAVPVYRVRCVDGIVQVAR